LSDFCHCDKIPERNQLTEEEVYFGSQFERLRLWSLGPGAFKPVTRKLSHASWQKQRVENGCSALASGKQKERKSKEPGTKYPLLGHTPLLPPTRPHHLSSPPPQITH
jgi:hypothetical protein